jgi:hypothetical protein
MWNNLAQSSSCRKIKRTARIAIETKVVAAQNVINRKTNSDFRAKTSNIKQVNQ